MGSVSSIAGMRASVLSGPSYCASKFGMNALGNSINLEESDNGSHLRQAAKYRTASKAPRLPRIALLASARSPTLVPTMLTLVSKRTSAQTQHPMGCLDKKGLRKPEGACQRQPAFSTIIAFLGRRHVIARMQ